MERSDVIVQRNHLRVNLDLREAEFQAQKHKKAFYVWSTTDTATKDHVPLPVYLAAVLREKLVDGVCGKQYVYQGAQMAFQDNKYFDLGNCTNNTATLVSLIPDPREDIGRFGIKQWYRELEYIPLALIMRVDNAPHFKLTEDPVANDSIIHWVNTSKVKPKPESVEVNRL